jgi:hypothetical protein
VFPLATSFAGSERIGYGLPPQKSSSLVYGFEPNEGENEHEVTHGGQGHFGTTEDPSGIDLPSIAAAHEEALKTAKRLVEGWAGVPPKYSDEIVIEVMNEQLRPVLIIPFSEFAAHGAPDS